jgi:putative oxidoreductase
MQLLDAHQLTQHTRGDIRMTTHDAGSRALRTSGTTAPRGRASLIALWVTQVALGGMFLMAGGSKLAGAPAMVEMFDAIGLGQWLRYVTGTIEVASAIALLVPASAPLGALLLIPTMIGATVANVFVINQSPAIPLVLCAGAAGVAWARRDQLRALLSRLQR